MLEIYLIVVSDSEAWTYIQIYLHHSDVSWLYLNPGLLSCIWFQASWLVPFHPAFSTSTKVILWTKRKDQCSKEQDKSLWGKKLSKITSFEIWKHHIFITEFFLTFKLKSKTNFDRKQNNYSNIYQHSKNDENHGEITVCCN